MTNKYLEQPLYHTWLNIKQRCNNKNNPSYKYYGQRGISVADEWTKRGKGYKSFYNWAIKNGYKKGLTLDRVDVNGNYCENNCRWVNMYEQNINKRNTYYVYINGEKIPLKEVAKKLEINYFTLHSRLKKHDISESSNNIKYSTSKISKTGYRYISFDKNGYTIRINQKYIGHTKTLEDAIKLRDSYCELCRKLFLGEEE